MKNKNSLTIFILLLLPILIWSVVETRDIGAWIAETLPLFIGLFVMIKSYRNFTLTTFSYVAIFVGATLMLIGSHYSYSDVPLCEWVQRSFGFERNNYDKIVHFFQGFIMATLMREIIIRKDIINSKEWRDFFTLSYAIALGAVWEIVEWFYVVIIVHFGIKEPASGFLGTQNYYWDAQSDMFFATLGALMVIVVLNRYHDKQINQLMMTT